MSITHPVDKILESLDRDDQFEADLRSIENDADFQTLSSMDGAQLEAEINGPVVGNQSNVPIGNIPRRTRNATGPHRSRWDS